MARISPLFLLPNTSTLLARTAIELLKNTNEAVLDEAIQTLLNRNISATAVMPHLEQNVNFSEVLEKLSRDWAPETVRAFAAVFNMDPSKTVVMDVIVAIAILNEADLESELRSENTPEATASDLLENRRIAWQYPPPGTVLNPPYVVLVAVEAVDTSKAVSEIQAILGQLVDYKGYKIARRVSTGPLKLRPDLINEIIKTRPLKELAVSEVVAHPVGFASDLIHTTPTLAAGAAAAAATGVGAEGPPAPAAAGTVGAINGLTPKSLSVSGRLAASALSRVAGGL